MNTHIYRAVACRIHHVDGQLAVLTSDLWPSGRPVAAPVAAALGQCLAERTLEAHQRAIAESLGQSESEAVCTVSALVELGLLRSVVFHCSRAHQATQSSTGIDVLGVMTADRPGMLRRCLTSYRDHLGAHQRSPRVVIVDGSRTRDSQGETQRVVSELTSEQLVMTYVGSQTRRDIRVRALEQGVSESVVSWLLPEPGPQDAPGANRNLLLLVTAGARLLMVDDDTVCRPWRMRPEGQGIAFTGHVEARQTRPFERREDVLAALHPVDVDLLAAHEALLGRSLFDLANAAEQARDLGDVCAHMVPGIDGSRPDWRVRATWSGIAGDGATFCPYPLLFSRGRTREVLSADERVLRTALTSREVIRGVPQNTVTDESSFMAYCAAIDNVSLTPPFLPVGTNEDGLFGAMLRMCDTSAFIGQIPYGILHDSGRPERFPEGQMLSATATRMSDFVALLTEPGMRQDLTTGVEARVRTLGAILIAAGSLTATRFRSLLADLVVEAKCGTLRAAEAALASGFSYPPHWRRSIRQYQQAVLTSLTSERLCLPADWEQCASVDAALMSMQTQLSSFGHALQAWPWIWSHWREAADWTNWH